MVSTQQDCDMVRAAKGISDENRCPIKFDGTLCWPETAINTTAFLQCPNMFSQFDTSKFVEAYCGANRTWVAFNYATCFWERNDNDDTDATVEQINFERDVIMGARTMEVVGLFLSFSCLVFALCVFSRFRSLQCHRTKIHKHLFVAYIARLSLEIVFGINRFYKITKLDVYDTTIISSSPPVCITLDVLREYTRFCTFAWMFIEGMYLNSLLSSAVFGKPKFVVFYVIGWVTGIPLILSWAVAMHFTIGSTNGCWYRNFDTVYYWIFIEVPRNSLLAMNLLFLINILRVLVTKLRESNTSETKQVRKAIKATFVLLPLLGVANLVWLISVPQTTDSPGWIVVYYYGLLFLDAYQGFFVSVLYCFFNAEVRSVIRRKWATWRAYHNPNRGHNMVVTTATDIRLTVIEDANCQSEA